MSAKAFVVLDPNTVSADNRGPSGSIDTVRYVAKSLPILHKRVTNVGLRSMVISNQAYNICDYSPYGLKNNVVTINGVDYTLPVGNYTATDLASALVTIFDTALGVGTVITINPLTLVMTITPTVPATMTLGTTSPYVEMGFAQGTFGPAASFTGSTALNLSGPANLFIYIQELQTGSLLYYNSATFSFCYPLTDQFPSQSQLNWINAGKTECPINIDQIYQLTVELWYTRDGVLWRYVSDPRASYQLMLEMS